MRWPFPNDAQRTSINDLTAWIWKIDGGLYVIQGPYEFKLCNFVRNAKPCHTIDAYRTSQSQGKFEQWLIRMEDGHLERQEFLAIVEEALPQLRALDALSQHPFGPGGTITWERVKPLDK